MGPNVPLDMILEKFTIIYGNVKSFDLLMRDFYRADQGEEETIPSFATRIEGLLSQIGTGSPIRFPSRRNRGSLGTTCSMEVERTSEIALSIALLMPVWIICSSLRNTESLRRRGRLAKLKPPLR